MGGGTAVHTSSNDKLLTVGDVAQLVERLLCKQDVVGSSPVVSTNPTVFRGNPTRLRSLLCAVSSDERIETKHGLLHWE